MVQSHRIKINWESMHCSLVADCLLVCRVHGCANSSMLNQANMCVFVHKCVCHCTVSRGIVCWGYGGCSVGRWIECFCAQSLSCLQTSRGEKGGIERGRRWGRSADKGKEKRRGDKIGEKRWEKRCEVGSTGERHGLGGWSEVREWVARWRGGEREKVKERKATCAFKNTAPLFSQPSQQRHKEVGYVGNRCFSSQ